MEFKRLKGFVTYHKVGSCVAEDFALSLGRPCQQEFQGRTESDCKVLMLLAW